MNVRVCLLHDKSIPCPEVVKVELDDGVIETIDVMRFQAREYKKDDVVKGKEVMPAGLEKVWVVKDSVGGMDQGHYAASSSGVKAIITPERLGDLMTHL
ncbi:hypothetical protein LINPERPRIM_LOCUS6763 [Linum perenne]